MILQSARSLYDWLRKQEFRGHDPHDLLESPMLPEISKRTSFSRLALLQLGRRAPLNLHTRLRVKPAFNPKGGGLILQGLLRGKGAVSVTWKEDTDRIESELLNSAVKTPHGNGWGYPFAWQSRTHYLLRNTPTIVTSSFVGQALLDLQEALPSDSRLQILDMVGSYIMNDVSKTETSEGIAFGYAENDPQIVFNASLLGAAFLARSSKFVRSTEYGDTALSAARFVVHHQNDDGSWWYGLEPSQRWMDSFHTGYVLLSLKQIAQYLGTSEFDAAIAKGYTYYRANFFIEDLPTYKPRVKYPIDTHAAAHAIITLREFGDSSHARHIADWMCKNMQSPQGYFYYQRHSRYTNKIPYIRWSNAWMFLALCTVLNSEKG